MNMRRDVILAIAFALSMVALMSYTFVEVSETKGLINQVLTK